MLEKINNSSQEKKTEKFVVEIKKGKKGRFSVQAI